MSRAAYEAHFGVAAPSNAIYGVDISYSQAYVSPSVLDYGFARSYWDDFAPWSNFVCIRTSYGGSGDDGAQDLHFQIASDIGYQGSLGCYHFIYAQSGVQANFNNYIRRTDPFVDRTSFDMLDFEVAPNAGAGFIDQFCDMVQQLRQRPCNIYTGKGYLDAAGVISCPADRLWVAHYAAGGSNPWVPTNNWASWNAPLMPDQYGEVLPGIWQWSSTASGRSLDLNISTTPSAVGIGIGDGDDMSLTADQSAKLDFLFAVFHDDDRWAKWYNASVAGANNSDLTIKSLPTINRIGAVVERINTDSYVKSTGHSSTDQGNSLNFYDEVRKAIATLNELTVGKGMDVNQLAKILTENLRGSISTSLSDADLEKIEQGVALMFAELLSKATP